MGQREREVGNIYVFDKAVEFKAGVRARRDGRGKGERGLGHNSSCEEAVKSLVQV